MPLPDADDPKTSNLYAQLRTSQLDSVTQDNFDKVKDPLYINAEWEDEARRLKLWGEISGKSSSSGPMPGTQKLISVTSTSQGTHEWFRPAIGEVWILLAAAVVEDDSSYHNIMLVDGDGTELFVAQETSATRYDPFPGLPLHFTYENYLAYNIPTSPGGGNNTIRGSVIRVR